MNNRKFAALRDIKTTPQEPTMPGVSIGRPKKGKKNNPDWKPAGVLLKIKTMRDARRKLEDTNDHRDLSELADELLSEWVNR